MPTENRSNTEMVSVQATIESLEEAYAGDSALEFMNDAAQLLRQFKSLSTLEHPGEPVALPSCNAKLSDSHDWDQGYRGGWRACLDEIAKLGPLYTRPVPGEPVAWRGINELGEVVTEWIDGTPPSSMVDLSGNPASFARIERAYPHADPGEIERLREEIETLKAAAMGIRDAWREDQAKLAERDELLGPIAGWTAETRAAVLEAFQDELNESASYPWYDAAIADLMKLIEALSASAEPSAPIAWHVGGNGYDRICFEEPRELPGHPCVQAINDQRSTPADQSAQAVQLAR